MDKREKAQDLFNKSTPFFGTKVPFRQAFPMIASISVEVTESDYGVHKERPRYYGETSVGEYINCTNPLVPPTDRVGHIVIECQTVGLNESV
jgi:hypothetical protein